MEVNKFEESDIQDLWKEINKLASTIKEKYKMNARDFQRLITQYFVEESSRGRAERKNDSESMRIISENMQRTTERLAEQFKVKPEDFSGFRNSLVPRKLIRNAVGELVEAPDQDAKDPPTAADSW